ncbi:tRNA(Ile)-lysidine synthase [Phycisphaerales bacterium]|nr:tRNA(Ile)-lysidine synthase [Phycisphaerales bacterium]
MHRDAAARTALRAWRNLARKASAGTPSRTLIACSGGADSTALVLVLSKQPDAVVVAHVVHDLRPRRQAVADRDAAKRLADRLGLRFCEASVRVRGRAGNPEANARRLRYAALARLARKHRCTYVATAHHADDLVESVLMRLLRGAGPRGLAAMRPSRPLDGDSRAAIRLIRPLLGVTRADAERICRVAGVPWQTDATNTDTNRLRAAIRARVLPTLRSLAPGYEARVVQAAAMLGQAADLIGARAGHVRGLAKAGEGRLVWERAALRRRRAIVLGECLRRAAIELGASADQLGSRVVDPVVASIVSASGERKEHQLGGVLAVVDRDGVRLGRVKNSRRTIPRTGRRPRRP